MGPDISKTNLDIQAWLDGMHGGHLIKATQAIESLRPKSPPDSSSGSTGWVPPTSVIFESLLSPHSAVSSLERDVSSPRSQDPAFQDSLLNACLQGIGGAPRQRQIAPVAGSQASRYGHMSAPFPFSGVSSQLKEHPFVHAVSELRHGLQNQCNDNISPRQAQFVHRNSHARPKQSVLAMKSPTPDLSHTSAQNYEHHPPLPLCVGRGFPALQPDYHDGLQLVQWTCQRRFHYTHGASWQGPSHKGGIPLSFTEPRPKGFSQEPQLGDVPRIFETGGHPDRPEAIATQLIVPQPISALPVYSQMHSGISISSRSVHSRTHHGPKLPPPHNLTSRSVPPSLLYGDLLPNGEGSRLLQVANCGRAAQVAGEGPSQFEALTARALQEAVAMPIYPPPPEWKPGNHLHPFYYEIAMSFQDCFGKILEARGVFNPTSFLEEWLDHVRQIFSGFEKQWEARDSGSTIGIGIASKWENAPIAAHALVQVLDLPTSPPLAGWKPGDLLHPYYGSLLNRFDDALRTMLADTHHPLCSDEKALTWVINVQACKIMQEIRDVWMANFAL